MSKQDYDAEVPAIQAIENGNIKEPDMPVAIALQEAEDLNEWCITDKEVLIKAGLDWKLVENLPQRIGALRYIQSQWQRTTLPRSKHRKSGKKNRQPLMACATNSSITCCMATTTFPIC